MFLSVLQCSQEENAMHIFKQTLFSGQGSALLAGFVGMETSSHYLCLNIKIFIVYLRN